MCGRYTVTQPKNVIRELHGGAESIDCSSRFNVAPGQTAPVIRADKPNNLKLASMSWGFPAPWAHAKGRLRERIINVRVETVEKKERFKECLESRRCVVLADGFYEWRRMQQRKQPYLFRLENGVPFGFAGILECADDDVQRFMILTTVANELVGEFHHRMPVILNERARKEWLGYTSSDNVLRGMSEPCTATPLERFPVGNYVNSPSNEGAGCIERVMDPEVDTLFS